MASRRAASALTLIRLEGIAASVVQRAQSLTQALAPFGGVEQRSGEASSVLWRSVRDVASFAVAGPHGTLGFGTWPVWRIVCPPAAGGPLGEVLRREAGAELIFDWAGGLIWAAVPPSPDARAAIVRREAGRIGGHATLIRASEAVKAGVRRVRAARRGARRRCMSGCGRASTPTPCSTGAGCGEPMKTEFSLAQLADPDIAEADKILRACVHCGFCTATCPTYVLLGDELDSPRGRIYLIKEMLEKGQAATKEVVKHIDRCLSCLACMTTCPSGVHYMHLVDHARTHIEETYRRPLIERALRAVLAFVLPSPGRFRASLRLAALAKPFAALLPRHGFSARLKAMLALAPAALPPAGPVAGDGVRGARGAARAGRTASGLRPAGAVARTSTRPPFVS